MRSPEFQRELQQYEMPQTPQQQDPPDGPGAAVAEEIGARRVDGVVAGVARLHAGPAAAVLVHQAARVADVPVLVHVVGAVLGKAAHDLRHIAAGQCDLSASELALLTNLACILCKFQVMPFAKQCDADIAYCKRLEC